jgi:hypothetical protein
MLFAVEAKPLDKLVDPGVGRIGDCSHQLGELLENVLAPSSRQLIFQEVVGPMLTGVEDMKHQC